MLKAAPQPLVLCLLAAAASALPTTAPYSGIAPCPVSSTDLEGCILTNLNTFIPLLAKGWTDLEVGLDPLLIPAADTSYEDGNASLSLNLKDVVIVGLANTRVYNVRAKSLEEGKLELMCKTPKVTATGIYASEGVVVTFPLHSSGPFNLTLVDLTSHLVVHLDRINDHLQVTDIGLNVMPALIDVQAGNQLDDDNNLGVTMNLYLNENAFELYNLIRPRLMDYFSDFIKTVANTMLWQAEESEVFPHLHLKR